MVLRFGGGEGAVLVTGDPRVLGRGENMVGRGELSDEGRGEEITDGRGAKPSSGVAGREVVASIGACARGESSSC